MTVRSAAEVALYWQLAGGPAARRVEWVAISMGESSLRDDAVSPAGAIGLFQIMPFNASIGGGTVHDLFNPYYNARVAVLMSNKGVNCAAWDSCYRNIYRSGRYSFLASPEPGSADYNNMAIAAAALGVDAVVTSLPEPSLGIGADIGNLASNVQQLVSQALPTLANGANSQRPVIGSLYVPGWRGWMSSGR